jgi:hypothetical protein
MIRSLALAALSMLAACTTMTTPSAGPTYVYEPWPPGAAVERQFGDAHGDIAVTRSGDIVLSIQDAQKPGVHVYGADGSFKRVVANTPADFHGFVLHTARDGREYIYGAGLNDATIHKIGLDGTVALKIEANAQIPDEYKLEFKGSKTARLSGIAVGPNDDIYVVDGYGLDYIHRFDPQGRYVETFAGRAPPWSFKNCHKIAVDPRFRPMRLICADRLNHRLVHLTLDGRVIGDIATGLRRPSAMAFHRDLLAVAEIAGRVSVLDKSGAVVATLGTNETEGEINTNRTAPEAWRKGVFTSPHGLAFDARGNLYVTEWNKWGRVVRFSRRR